MGLASTNCFHFAAYTSYDFLAPKRAFQEDVVINKQHLVKNKLFHLNEHFQLINSMEKV